VAVSRSLRAPLAGVVVAIVALAGAVAGSRIVADDGDDDVIRLETPGEYVDPAVSNPPNDGATFPAVELVGDSGAATTLRGDGRPMVVNLWYSTCPPCARELTYFAAVADDLGADVRFVGVNPLDDDSTMRSFAAERGVEYELLRDPDGALDAALGIVQYPATLFVDADGEVVAQTGVLSEGGLRDQVAELLA
jgi:thiol-disulfide isomerase/thioredoxin